MNVEGAASRTVAAELLRCVLQLQQPKVRRNPKQAGALLAADFVGVAVSGRVWSREKALATLAGETLKPPIIEDFLCRKLAARVALVTYRAVQMNEETGESQTTLRSSVWSRHTKGWILRFHQETWASASTAATSRDA